jgi:hypothetical protein
VIEEGVSTPAVELLVPPAYLAAIRRGQLDAFPIWGNPPQVGGPLPPEAAFFYAYGACSYLAFALCAELASAELAVVVYQGCQGAEAEHLYAVREGFAYDVHGRQALRALANRWQGVVSTAGEERLVSLVDFAEWEERWLGEERFAAAIPDSPAVRTCARHTARVLLSLES